MRIAGLRTVPDKKIRDTIAIDNGAPYGETKLEAARKRLLDTGLFRNVVVSTEGKPSPTRITVTFELESLRWIRRRTPARAART